MLDVDSDGVVSFEDFMSCCLEDQTINQSLKAFECIRIMAQGSLLKIGQKSPKHQMAFQGRRPKKHVIFSDSIAIGLLRLKVTCLISGFLRTPTLLVEIVIFLLSQVHSSKEMCSSKASCVTLEVSMLKPLSSMMRAGLHFIG